MRKLILTGLLALIASFGYAQNQHRNDEKLLDYLTVDEGVQDTFKIAFLVTECDKKCPAYAMSGYVVTKRYDYDYMLYLDDKKRPIASNLLVWLGRDPRLKKK